MLDAVELMPDGDPVEKASVMFDKMDDDGSGELTEDEFIKVSQIETMNLGLSVIVYNTCRDAWQKPLSWTSSTDFSQPSLARGFQRKKERMTTWMLRISNNETSVVIPYVMVECTVTVTYI